MDARGIGPLRGRRSGYAEHRWPRYTRQRSALLTVNGQRRSRNTTHVPHAGQVLHLAL